MDDADAVLVRAWALGVGDYTDEVFDAFEEMLPTLVAAGYAEADGHTWHFTQKGVERADELLPVAPED